MTGPDPRPPATAWSGAPAVVPERVPDGRKLPKAPGSFFGAAGAGAGAEAGAGAGAGPGASRPSRREPRSSVSSPGRRGSGGLQGASWGSDSNVSESCQALTSRQRDSARFRFSISILESDFSIQTIGDEFREEKSRWNWVHQPSTLFFSPLLSEPLFPQQSGRYPFFVVFCLTGVRRLFLIRVRANRMGLRTASGPPLDIRPHQRNNTAAKVKIPHLGLL
jgi:hypothetical protein